MYIPRIELKAALLMSRDQAVRDGLLHTAGQVDRLITELDALEGTLFEIRPVRLQLAGRVPAHDCVVFS